MRGEATEAELAAEWQERVMREDAERRERIARRDLRVSERIADAACSDRAAGAPVESRPEAPALARLLDLEVATRVAASYRGRRP